MSVQSTQVLQIPQHDRTNKTIQDNSWMDTVERFINAGFYTPPGIYVDDADAETHGVPIGALYRQAAGVVVWRVS